MRISSAILSLSLIAATGAEYFNEIKVNPLSVKVNNG